MTHDTIQRDIDKLKDAFPQWPDFQRTMEDLEERLRKVIEQEQLSDHPAIQELVKGFQGVIDMINHNLQTKRSAELSDQERDRSMDVRDLYERIITIFKPPTKEFDAIQQTVEETKRQNNIQ